MFSGRVVSGAEAVDMCLDNRCVPDAVQVAVLIWPSVWLALRSPNGGLIAYID